MNKEMKKLLLVAVSVGVFLLVTITAAILVVTPKVNTQEAAFTSSHPITAGRVQPVSEPIDIQIQPGIDNAAEANIVNRENDAERLTIQIPKPSAAAIPDDPEIQPAAVATIKPAPTTAAAPAATPAAPAATPAAPAATPAAKTAAPAPTPAPKPAAAAAAPKPAATPATAPKPAAAAPKPAPVKTTNDYWVQTGAFIAKIRAEDAKETLASKGITSIIENRQVDGKTWYRVRLGPYTSEKEANYWLALVKAIDGFGESQVRQTVRQQ